MADAKRDQNYVPTLLAVSSADGTTPVTLYADPTTHRLYVDLAVGSGTVTSVSVVTAQGVSGSVATATTTPAITLTFGAMTGVTSFNGLVVTANTGAITTGSWAATAIPLTKGGTGADLNAVAKGGLISGTGAGTVGLTTVGTDGQVLSADAASAGGIKWITAGTGTVTSVSVTTANGVSGSVATATSTPAITLTLGNITPTTVNKVTLTTPATGSTLTIVDGKTLTASNTLTLAGTDSTTMTFPSTSATIARTDAANTFTGHQTIEGVTSTGATGTGQFVFDTTPTLVTPVLGVATATSINKVAITAPASSATLTIANTKTLTASNTLTFAGTDSTTITFQATDTYVGRATTDTLTNKRVTPRVTSETSSATPTINTDNSDCHSITALAAAVTSMTTNLSGTPTNFQKLIVRFKDNGTARAITWGASFEAKGVALPTTTVISKVLTVGFLYDTVSAKWGCVASVTEA